MATPDAGDYLSIQFAEQNDPVKHQDSLDLLKRTLPFSSSQLYMVEIIRATMLTTGKNVKIVYDLALNIEGIHYEFEPGDTVGILPSNNSEEVDELINHLNLTSVANRQFYLRIMPDTKKKKVSIPSHIPTKSTLREVLLKCVDIRSVPKKLFLRSLIRYTTQPDEIETLQNLCSANSSQQYSDFISKNRTLLSLLKSFPSCCPPIERLLEQLPPLMPRVYSISSSPLCNNSSRELHITFAVINIDQDTKGVCTGWLQKLIETSPSNNKNSNIEGLLHKLHIDCQKRICIPLYFRKSNSFRLPMDPTIPIIMIGPGTGVAPFAGFLEHRYLQTQLNFGPSWLFFGCRYSDRDFLFKDKIQTFQQNGTLTKLFVCFSRENNKKVYVQDLIVENKKDFVYLIKAGNAVIYVCGDAKNMLKDIKSAVVSCLVEVERLSNEEAEVYVKEMEKTNRYITDIWI